MIVGPLRDRIARVWKMSMLSFQIWASVDFGPVQSRTLSKRRPYLWVLQALYVPHTGLQDWPYVVPKPVRRLHGPALHPMWSGRNLLGKRTGSSHTGQKITRTHGESGERMWQLHRRRLISYGLPTDHRLLWLPKSYEPAYPWVSCMQFKH